MAYAYSKEAGVSGEIFTRDILRRVISDSSHYAAERRFRRSTASFELLKEARTPFLHYFLGA